MKLRAPAPEALVRRSADVLTMSNEPRIKESYVNDEAALAPLYMSAFPHEDLMPLVKRLLAEVPDIISLVAVIGEKCVGHILLTPCGVDGANGRIALLGPLGVAPTQQRKGVGGMLVREGLTRIARTSLRQVLVLGDPAYYGRFGFRPEKSILPPYDLPEDWSEAWQSVLLENGGALQGVLRPPGAWLVPSLWAP
jgi:putative acetyltransferase